MDKQFSFIEVNVGKLPEWYIEAEHDGCLEYAIERYWSGEADEVKVVYGYWHDDSIVSGYDDDGNRIMERDHNINYAFRYAQENC